MTDQEILFQYTLRLGDNCIVLSHRLAELVAWGPVLEEDIAQTNISLDLIGQGTGFLQYAAQVENKGRTEDDLVYLRSEREYFNFQLLEQPNDDFAHVVVRQLFADVFNFYLYEQLIHSKDEQLAGVAAKALKEVTFHLRRSSQWVLRLGKGTAESHERTQAAVNKLWKYTAEMFVPDAIDDAMLAAGIGADLNDLKTNWDKLVNDLFERANLKQPENGFTASGSKKGVHTEYLGHMLSDMQYLQRAHPGAKW